MIGCDQIEHASLTDVGVRRSHNQDSHAVLLAGDAEQWQKHGHVFLVADGMGAHAVGELASELAAGIIPHTYHKYAAEGSVPALRKAFEEANASIHARGQQNREFHGMGTTGSCLLIRADGAWIGHVGDSRVYRIRDEQIEQLSFDHSLAWEMGRRKKMKPGELEGVPTNILIRSLGPEPAVQVDVEGPHPLRSGDIFVLCSDGLTGPLSDHEIGTVARTLPPAEACQFLVDLANLRGGPDNITVLVIRVGEIASDHEPSAAPADVPKKHYLRLPPWPFIAMVLGLLLAAAAVNLSASGPTGTVPVFALAALALLAGLTGLALRFWREQYELPDQGHRRRVKAYRHTECRIERPLVDRVMKAETALAQQARERQADADWDTYQAHHELASACLAQQDLAGAFREFCRAILPLAEALHRLRNKGEVFQPIWEKSGS